MSTVHNAGCTYVTLLFINFSLRMAIYRSKHVADFICMNYLWFYVNFAHLLSTYVIIVYLYIPVILLIQQH